VGGARHESVGGQWGHGPSRHGAGDVSGLGTRGPGGVSHGVHHARDAARLASHVALVDGSLLEKEHLGRGRTGGGGERGE